MLSMMTVTYGVIGISEISYLLIDKINLIKQIVGTI